MKNKLHSFIAEWNSKYFFDYLWRKKYKVSFGSKQHLEMDFISMKLDLIEENVFKDIRKHIKEVKYIESIHNPKILLQKRNISHDLKMNSKEADFLFENMNLEDFNDKKADNYSNEKVKL